jgi:hypothetical protein
MGNGNERLRDDGGHFRSPLKIEDLTYLAVGPFTWGRGKSEGEALKQAKANWVPCYAGPWKKTKCSLYLTTDEAVWLDIYGRIHSRAALTLIRESSLLKQKGRDPQLMQEKRDPR